MERKSQEKKITVTKDSNWLGEKVTGNQYILRLIMP